MPLRVPFRRRREHSSPPSAQPAANQSHVIPPSLAWLGDSPLFIDKQQVQSFYDAVIRPEFEHEAIVLSNSVTQGTQIGGNLTVGSAFPWVKAELGLSATHSHQQATGDQVSLKPVDNAHRQLEHLALYYLDRDLNDPHTRMRAVTCTRDAQGDISFEAVPPVSPAWNDPQFILQMPRALLFLDLSEDSRLIPAALETVKGKVITLYERFADEIKRHGEKPPAYPGSAPALQEEREKYWDWFDERFNDTAAMEVVEKAVDTERIQWIAYRVGMGPGQPSLHLQVCGRGDYDTGTFAYQFIKRGSKHGLRLVGTLKSEPDMNVLAIFEK
jgi:hypothetical protein